MSELVATVPATHRTWSPRAAVAVAAVVAAIVVAIALLWPSGGASTPVERFDIPQRVITQAEQERAAWERLGTLIDQQQSTSTCRMGRPC